MVNFIVRIPGPVFLVYFLIFSAICIFFGLLLLRILKGKVNDNKISVGKYLALTPSAFSYLRGGWHGVVQSALFSLFHKGIIEIAVEKRSIFLNKSTVISVTNDGIKATSDMTLFDPAEKSIYDFLQKKNKKSCYASEIPRDQILRIEIQEEMAPVLEEMQKLGLLRTAEDHCSAWMVTLLVMAAILVFGGTKLYFGLKRNKPVELLFVMLAVALVVSFKIINPFRSVTAAGKEYLEQVKMRLEVQQRFALAAKDKTVPDGLNLSYLFAVCGIAAVASMEQYDLFCKTFARSDGGGGGCGGGGGGGGGGCGGGCGGCGGGD